MAPAATVGGSAFRAEFMPQGKESGIAVSAMVVGGATIAEVGPYQMRMHAFGKDGDQRWFEIKRLSLSGKDGFEAPMEPRGFEGRAAFAPTQTAGVTRASLLLGPYIRLDAKKTARHRSGSGGGGHAPQWTVARHAAHPAFAEQNPTAREHLRPL
jgi:hypothetical protein